MYSDISILIIFFSSSNNVAAKVFPSSVLPTPVGPKNKNDPIGLFGLAIPALALIIASLTFLTASSWPTTLWCNISSKCSNFSFSASASFETGIPVHFETTFAISSSVTLFLKSEFFPPWVFSISFSSCSNNFFKFGNVEYFNSAALFKS